MRGMKKEKKQNKEKKSFPVLPTILGGLILLATAAYTAGFVYYQNHFLDGTVVDDIDVSKMTIGELKGQMEQYLLQVTERKTDGSTLEEEIQGKEIDLTYSSVEPLEEFLQEQNTWLWFLPQKAEHRTEGLVSYSEEKLEERVQNLQGFQKEFATSPTDAYISEYSKENGYELIPETQGNELEPAKTLETIQEAIQGLAERIDLDEAGCYKTPKVTSEDEQLLKALEQLKKYADIEITYTFGERQEIID
ncbi:MAG: peptidoglycan binding domain-containing protein, partial [Lachnospiraceae bacterium]|nr:peptidoglycan binding domain-containing protein [Lachnospiraceae bacterium]